MRARDLIESYPVATPTTPALEAAKRLAAGRLCGLVVVDQDARPVMVLPATQVLRLGVPQYCQDDPALARVIDEVHADVFLRELGDRTLAEVLPRRPDEPPVVDEDATVLEIAALMTRTRSPVVAITGPSGSLAGVVTLPRLIERIVDR